MEDNFEFMDEIEDFDVVDLDSGEVALDPAQDLIESIASPIEEPTQISSPGAVDAGLGIQAEADPEPGPGLLSSLGNVGSIQAVLEASRPGEVQQDEKLSPRANTQPLKTPPGMTQIPPQMFMPAVQAAAQSYPSMNEVGILLSPQDRAAFAMSVISNQNLRSDMKAQIADQVMKDGKIALEALPREWYEARNLIVP